MALPATAPVVQCSLSKPLLAEGTSGSITNAYLSIDRNLIWADTGDTIYKDPVPVLPQTDGSLQFDVIPVDVDGVMDSAGNFVKSWAYSLKVTLTLASGVQKTVTYSFQPNSGAAVDLDLVPQVGAVSDPPITSGSYFAISNNLSELLNPTAARANLELGNVDNTSDNDKPVSAAQQAALDLKQNHADMDADVGYLVSNGSETKTALDAAYGSLGWKGQWVAGSYSPGNLVASGNYLVTPRVTTSDDPSPVSTTDGDVDTAGWNRFNVASAAGGIVTLVNNTTSSAATIFGKTAFDTASLLSVAGQVWITGSADGLQMGIFDSTAAQGAGSTGQALKSLAGFYGVDFNIYNNRVDWVINGVATSGPSFGAAVVRTDGTNFDLRELEYRSIGGGQFIMVYKGNYQSPAFFPPAAAVLAFGGRSGGQVGTFKVQGSPVLKTFSTNWRRLSLLVDVT